MLPARLKLTMTVMSIGLARDNGGGRPQLCSLTSTSLRVSSCGPCSARAGPIHAHNTRSVANQQTGLPRRATAAHLMSDATCTFTILSGSATGSPRLILSTTSMPETTSPTTVYLPFSDEPSAYMMKNCELAELGSPARAMPTMPRLNGTLENWAARFGYLEPPVPLKRWPSPVCAMKPSITRWNGTLL